MSIESDCSKFIKMLNLVHINGNDPSYTSGSKKELFNRRLLRDIQKVEG